MHRPPSRGLPQRRPPSRAARGAARALSLVLAMALAGCATAPVSVYQSERFDPLSQHSRGFDESADVACEAARRALLSQGYVTLELRRHTLSGRKSFQPREDVHVEIEISVSCVPDGRRVATGSTAFVSATQERFALKKTSSSASVGVGPVGSVSLPFGSSNDSLVKVASETITLGTFYDRFFALLQHYLASQPEPDEPAELGLPQTGTNSGTSPGPNSGTNPGASPDAAADAPTQPRSGPPPGSGRP